MCKSVFYLKTRQFLKIQQNIIKENNCFICYFFIIIKIFLCDYSFMLLNYLCIYKLFQIHSINNCFTTFILDTIFFSVIRESILFFLYLNILLL